MFAAYFESWVPPPTPVDKFDTALVNVPRDISIVMLAFMRPDSDYSGQLRLAGSGLDFQYSGVVLQNSLRELRKRNPGVKIFISVGGEADNNWEGLNAQAVAQFVKDFDLDGVDIDFEPSETGCQQTDESISCKTDALLQRSIRALRSSIPSSVKLSLTSSATGAFGEGRWKDAQPTGGPGYGLMVQFLRSPGASDNIDFLNIMAYDAGPQYDPLQGLDAFQYYYKRPILLGFTPPPEDWGGHTYSPAEVTAVLDAALSKGAAGAMLFGLRKESGPGGYSPFVRVISAAIARSRN